MTILLPDPIAAYFAADQKDGGAVAQCFTETATVVDERQTHTGRDAIGRWKTEASAKFSYTTDPFAISEEDGQTIILARVEGNFPGSPINLRYAFVLDGDRIARLEVTP